MPAHKQRNQLPQRYQIAGFACPHQTVQISLKKADLVAGGNFPVLKKQQGLSGVDNACSCSKKIIYSLG
jgi:hypothetical protein